MLGSEKGDRVFLPRDQETKALGKRIVEAYKFRKAVVHHPTLMLDSNSETASEEFQVQMAESQYRAFISEGDFLGSSGCEEEIVFSGRKDGGSTAGASCNRDEDGLMVDVIRQGSGSLGVATGSPSSPADVTALQSKKWVGETAGALDNKSQLEWAGYREENKGEQGGSEEESALTPAVTGAR